MAKRRLIDKAWLAEHYPKMTCITELADDYERELGWRPKETTLYMAAKRLGIKRAPVGYRAEHVERMVCWDKEPKMRAWMDEHDQGQRTDRLSDEFREAFGFSLTRGQIGQYRANTGKHALIRTNSNGGRKRVPVGTERASKDGYVVVKFREDTERPMSKDNWKLKHVLVYEQNFGPVPEDCRVYFADGDNRNFDPENLVAVPKNLVGVMNSMKSHEGVVWHDKKSLLAVIALAELRHQRVELLRDAPHKCPICGRTFTNRARGYPSNINAKVCPECGMAGYKSQCPGAKRKYDHEEIRRLHAQGLSGVEVARIVGCSPATVSDVVSGRHAIGKRTKGVERS